MHIGLIVYYKKGKAGLFFLLNLCMDFWKRVKDEIKVKKTTQEWIARQVGVPFGTFRKWMTRKTYPNVKVGQEIANLLETSVEYLITGIEPEGLSDDERKLMNAYRKLSPADKENVMMAVNVWAGKKRHSLLRKSATADTGQD